MAAHLPGSPIIRKKLAYHLRGNASDETDQTNTQAKTKAAAKRKTTKNKTGSRGPGGTPQVQCEWKTTVPGGWICMEWKGHSHCSYQPPVTSFVCDGGSGGGGGPHWPPRDECWPTDCFGGGGGSGIGNLAVDITVKNSIINNDLTNCVYNKLNNFQIFQELIGNFQSVNSTFDLIFELAETEDNDFGVLEGAPPNDFVVKIDASWVTVRNGIEVTSTFLHETMHAEMRRYLYDQQQNGSTIPGFPGSFTEDWNNYVRQKTGGVSSAEH